MKSKFKNYFNSVFSNFSNFSKIISREIRENNYFEFLEKFSRSTQSIEHPVPLSVGISPPPPGQVQYTYNVQRTNLGQAAGWQLVFPIRYIPIPEYRYSGLQIPIPANFAGSRY
jgi:hypothetical protein